METCPMSRVGDDVGGAGEFTNLAKDLHELANRVMTYGVPDLRVQRWLAERRQRPIIVAGTVLALFLIAKIAAGAQRVFGERGDNSHNLWANVFSWEVLYFVEAFVLIIFVLYVVLKGYRDQNAVTEQHQNAGLYKRAIVAENRFFQYWPWLLVAWFALYILLAIQIPTDSSSLLKVSYDVLRNLLNNLTCIPLFGMYYELAEKTVDDSKLVFENVSAIERITIFYRRRPWLPTLLIVTFVLGATEFYLRISILDYADNVGYAASLISGLLVGTCTGLFVSKLTSNLFDLPLPTLLLLTLYAVIQPVFSVIAIKTPLMQDVAYAVVLTALYAKFWLLVVVEWKRDRYRILYFMSRVPQIIDSESQPDIARNATLYEKFKEWAQPNLKRVDELISY
jgi:hypothetical protein